MSEERPSYDGLWRGVVVSSADPQRQRRLQLKVPAINGNGVFPWALPCFPFLTQQPQLDVGTETSTGVVVTGKTKKITVRLPKQGDAVWVMFEQGNPDKPVWLGTWIGV